MYRNMYFNMAATLMLLFEYLFFRVKYNSRTRNGKFFKSIILCILCATVFNILSEWVYTMQGSIPDVLIYVVYSVYFVFVVGSASMMCEYTRALNPGGIRIKFLSVLNQIFAALHVLLCILNVPFHVYCRISESGPFERGPLYIVMYLISFYYLVFSIVEMFMNYKSIKKTTFWAIGGFISLTCAGAVIQFFVLKNTVVIYYLYTLATFVLLSAFETPDFENLIHTSEELKKSQAELTDAKAREDELYATVRKMTKLASWVLYFGEDGQVNDAKWSPEFVHMMGYADGEYEGDPAYLWMESLYPDDKEMASNAFLAGMQGAPYKIEARLVDKNGNIRWYECSGELKKDSDGNTTSYQGFIRDIDDEKRMRQLNEEKLRALEELEKSQEELKKALFDAKEASSAKTAFLSNMSHDIRTPMNAIVGYTQLARENIDQKDKVEECLENIGVSSEHLLNLINDVLDMSRIESGKVKVNEEPADLISLMSNIENMTHANVEEKNQEYVTEIIDVTDPCVLCDRLRINQVLINCIGNAVKYTDISGHIRVRLSQKPSDREGYADYIFSVKDDGMGMTEEFLSKLFEPFERDNDSRVGQIQGTGLGMAITKNLVEMMGGSIEVSSRINEGSEFIITIPMKKISRARFDNYGNENNEEVSLDQMISALGKKKFLVVDDNKVNRTIAKSLLQSRGMIIEECGSGQEAVDRLNNAFDGEFDIVFMDIQMPEMDGFQTTDIIRRSDRSYLKKLKIIAMTANAFEEDIQNEKDHGMDGHVTKPFKIDELVKVIYHILIEE